MPTVTSARVLEGLAASRRALAELGIAVDVDAVGDDALLQWREAVLRLTDLRTGYDWHDWPADYVRLDLERMTMLWNSRRPMGLTGLPQRALHAPPAQRLAWLLGRATIEGLDPVGTW